MPTHSEIREVPYSAEQMYKLVADVERYPEFLPWCLACRVREKTENKVLADVIIGYKFFREQYSSRVTFTPFKRVDVEYEKGPLRHLNNHWVFKEIDEHRCKIDFYVDFAFTNSLFQHAIELFFNKAVTVMINAFEKRAEELYGKPSN